MYDAALVLEGGSLRSLYTAGVLDVFMKYGLEFSCVIAVSAGALTSANYISRQPGRSARINIMHSADPEYYGLRQLLAKKSAFNFEYLFHSPIIDLYPFDHDTYCRSKMKYIVSATDCISGEPVYFEKHSYDDLLPALRASSSIPLLAPEVEIDGYKCLDGGISDPIGISKALEEGFEKIVVVQTREKGFRKEDTAYLMRKVFEMKYRKYPNLVKKLIDMPGSYNRTLERIENMEADGKAFVIRPQHHVAVRRMEKNMKKLAALYLQGRDDGEKNLTALKDYIDMPMTALR